MLFVADKLANYIANHDTKLSIVLGQWQRYTPVDLMRMLDQIFPLGRNLDLFFETIARLIVTYTNNVNTIVDLVHVEYRYKDESNISTELSITPIRKNLQFVFTNLIALNKIDLCVEVFADVLATSPTQDIARDSVREIIQRVINHSTNGENIQSGLQLASRLGISRLSWSEQIGRVKNLTWDQLTTLSIRNPTDLEHVARVSVKFWMKILRDNVSVTEEFLKNGIHFIRESQPTRINFLSFLEAHYYFLQNVRLHRENIEENERLESDRRWLINFQVVLTNKYVAPIARRYAMIGNLDQLKNMKNDNVLNLSPYNYNRDVTVSLFQAALQMNQLHVVDWMIGEFRANKQGTDIANSIVKHFFTNCNVYQLPSEAIAFLTDYKNEYIPDLRHEVDDSQLSISQ